MSNKEFLTGQPTRDMLGRAMNLTVAEAGERILASAPPAVAGRETVPLLAALGRVSAAAVTAPEDLPAHPRSTMDGFAVRAAETFGASEGLPAYLAVTGEVAMGVQPAAGPAPGACFTISTGGLLPPGTDAVLMLEHAVPVDAGLIEVTAPVAPGRHVMLPGEDVGRGQEVLPAGRRLRPQDLGLLAALGVTGLSVRAQPTVGILATGDELVPYEEAPGPGRIRDCNSVTLAALAAGLGAAVQRYGILPDEEERLLAALAQALAETDLVLFSGGSSVGSRDLGARIIDRLGPPGVLVHGVRMKPGKPVIFGLAAGKPVFGLPGHPVSAAVAFEVFVRPLILRLAGEEAPPRRPCLPARLMRHIRSAAGRRDYVRVALADEAGSGEVTAWPVLGQSGSLSTLVRADGWVVVPESREGIPAGEMVAVQLFA
ncbi:MAG: gephyrin-like molybdotransferase Glp [Thermodesulfobacteriota bacterium]